MSVILRKRPNSDGTTSLILDIYFNGKRKYEFLKSLKLEKPTTIVKRETNRDNLRLAEEIRAKRSQEIAADDYGIDAQTGKNTIVTQWMQSYVDKYKKKDVRNMQGVLNRFSDFLQEVKKPGLTFGNLNALLIEDFIDYLEAKSIGEGASSYYTRFKKMLKNAYRKRLMKNNVLDFVERKAKGKAKKKDVLTVDELQKLSSTQVDNSEIKRAFLFSAVTGLRWCDVKTITWQDIDISNRQMSVKQSKTGEVVTIPLNDTAMKLLGKPRKKDNMVFELPTANGANKTVKAWVKRAGISKKITWHNARHSFGTNLIYNDVDVLTASKLLGHTSLKHTQRYVNIANEMKQKATDKLNFNL